MFFKEKIYRKELTKFVLEGLLGAIVFGSLLGAINFYLSNSSLDFFNIFTFIILYYFLVKRLYQSFHFYHITYSILAIVFLFLGDYFVVTARLIMQNLAFNNYFWIGAFNPKYYLLSMFYLQANGLAIFLDAFHILIYVLISYSIFMRMKR